MSLVNISKTEALMVSVEEDERLINFEAFVKDS